LRKADPAPAAVIHGSIDGLQQPLLAGAERCTYRPQQERQAEPIISGWVTVLMALCCTKVGPSPGWCLTV
jgi:hypothetical protein